MATVEQIAKASLQRILVQASEAPLEADEYADYIFALNNYMTALEADGISLGYTVVADLSDAVTVPTAALRGIIANMAVEVAADYGGIVSESLIVAALNGMKTMRLIGQIITPSRYPGTLPRGSGNSNGSNQLVSNFYPDGEAAILAETTGAIGLETNT